MIIPPTGMSFKNDCTASLVQVSFWKKNIQPCITQTASEIAACIAW